MRVENCMGDVAKTTFQQPLVVFFKDLTTLQPVKTNGDEVHILRHDLSELVGIVLGECC